MSINLPTTQPAELAMRPFMTGEYQDGVGEQLRLRRRMTRALTVGEKLEGKGVEHGKLLEFLGTGRFAPVGIDLIGRSWPTAIEGEQALIYAFSDGARAIAVADDYGARCYCSCPVRGAHCVHRSALLFQLGGLRDIEHIWMLEDPLHEQFMRARARYRAARADTMALLEFIDAGYVCLRDQVRVELDDRDLRRRLAGALGISLRPRATRTGTRLRSALSGARSGAI